MRHSTQILLGLSLGLVCGLLVAADSELSALNLEAYISPIGLLWVNAIRMTVIPLLMALLITAIAGNETGSDVLKLGARTLGFIVAMIALSSSFAFLFAAPLVMRLSIDPSASDALLELTGSNLGEETALPPFSDWLISLVPSNPIAAAAAGDILPLMVFTGLFAVALLQIETEKRHAVTELFGAIKNTMYVLIRWVMNLAPFGIFALVFPIVATLGAQVITALASFLFITCGLIVLLAVSLYGLVWWLGVNPVHFARALAPLQIIGFSTRSSLAALPATVNATSTLGVPEKTSGLVLPIAVSLFKFASPLARTAGTYFIAVLYGIDLDPPQLIVIALSIGLLSFYSPGIPSGGLLIMTPVYVSLGLPVAGIGILIAIDLVVDMFITAANVTANATLALFAANHDSVENSATQPADGLLRRS
ncbi:MAG: dicarboxylate/amino acid:cation symporter [Pseudomonadales bacterium]|nr:dicarboxylate/amino acid:cation symporter [Pseudomonadales bacterium]